MDLTNDLKSICSICYCLPECNCKENGEVSQRKIIDLIEEEIKEEKSNNVDEIESSDEQNLNPVFQYDSWENSSESDIDENNTNPHKMCNFVSSNSLSEKYEDMKRKHRYSTEDHTEMNDIYYSFPHPDSERADTVKEVFFLKCRERTEINPSETKIVETNMKIKHNFIGSNRKLEITDQISSGWLDEYFLKLMSLKTGVISPSFQGTVYVKIYNKSNLQVTIPKNAPIGTMISSVYEYI